MKEQNEINKGGGVRKFRYVGPQRKETLPQQWSYDLGRSSNKTTNKQLVSGLDLDNVWSIKRNVSVDSKMKHSSDKYGFAFPGIKRDTMPKIGNTFYSRHKTITANPVSEKSDMFSPDKPPSLTVPTQRPWQRGSAQTNSNASSSPQNSSVISEDEFDFAMPMSNAKKWNTPARNASQSPASSSRFQYANAGSSDKVQGSFSKSTQGLGNMSSGTGNFNSKYNVSSFDF